MAYKMTHPDADHEVEADARYLEMYQSQGWETSPHANPPADSDEKTDKPKK